LQVIYETAPFIDCKLIRNSLSAISDCVVTKTEKNNKFIMIVYNVSDHLNLYYHWPFEIWCEKWIY